MHPSEFYILERQTDSIRAQLAKDAAEAVSIDPIEAETERLAKHRERLIEQALIRDVAGERSFRALLERVAKSTVDLLPPPPPFKPIKTGRAASQETMVQMLSDFHAYEFVKASRTRGINEYTADIFGRRARGLVENHVSIKRRLERGGGWRFRELVVALNGDIISGTIHELERHSDAPNVVLAVYGAARVLALMLRDLAANYVSVRAFCISGNHGRLPDAKRMQQKDPLRNWDAMIYILAKEMLADCETIEFIIPDSYSVAYEVEGWRFIQTHGHSIKSWNQIPYYGINRQVTNLNALEADRGSPVNYWLFSHFHSASALPASAGKAIINGSLIGPNEFTINELGKADKPLQVMFGVHPEQGITHFWEIHATEAEEGYPVRAWEEL